MGNTSREVEAAEATVVEFDEFKACNCDETTCPICMEEFEDNKNQMILPWSSIPHYVYDEEPLLFLQPDRVSYV